MTHFVEFRTIPARRASPAARIGSPTTFLDPGPPPVLTPEPGTVSLALAGCIGLGLVHCVRRRWPWPRPA